MVWLLDNVCVEVGHVFLLLLWPVQFLFVGTGSERRHMLTIRLLTVMLTRVFNVRIHQGAGLCMRHFKTDLINISVISNYQKYISLGINDFFLCMFREKFAFFCPCLIIQYSHRNQHGDIYQNWFSLFPCSASPHLNYLKIFLKSGWLQVWFCFQGHSLWKSQ